MTKYILLADANPKLSRGSAKVKLPAGKWNIKAEGRVDSLFNLSVYSPDNVSAGVEQFIDQCPLNISEPRSVLIGFTKRGTEDSVNIFAEG